MTDIDLHRAAGQLLTIGFPGDADTPPDSVAEALAEGTIGGVILFRRNVRDIEQVAALNAALHAAALSGGSPVPFIALDQEGGRVVRLRDPLTPIPPMRVVGDRRSTDLASRIGEVVATEVAAVGFNVNFSPVLDVDTNPNNPVIGDRSFSRDPRLVAQMAGAWQLGHNIAGVIACGKHFPGHGDTDVDSHHALPTILHDMKRLEAVELVPFRAAISAKFPMIMTAHIICAALDPVYPATLSPAVIDALLRKKMGYEGVIVSDCLEMKAVADHYTITDMVERSLMAGVDHFLICHTEAKWRAAHAHLVARASEDDAVRARLIESAQRVAALKDLYFGTLERPWTPAPGWRDVLGCARHRAILARLDRPSQDSGGVDPTEA
jgi:beta-N-acetylhexosaminidase